MILFEGKYWWTFQEAVYFIVDDISNIHVNPWVDLYSDISFDDIFDGSEYQSSVIITDSVLKAFAEELFKLIYTMRYDDYVFSTEESIEEDEDADTEEMYANCYKLFGKYFSIMNATYDKYYQLLKYYAEEKDSLLAQVSTTSTGMAKFNDTPQNSEGGDYSLVDDDHLTNVTETTGTTTGDVLPVMERIKQIQESYRDILHDWAREFRGLFIDEGNLTL